MEKTIEVQWKGNPEKVTVRSLTYGEYKKIKRKSVVLKEYKDSPMQFRDMDLYVDLKILTCIKDAPFEKTQDNLYKLSLIDGEKLEVAVEEVNAIPEVQSKQ